MGRAYEVRKASIAKTGAARAKVYSNYAKEIYSLAKKGGTDLNSNLSLKHLIEKAKKAQVPGDIIKRALDKVNSGVDENYLELRYEGFGPEGSNIIIDCLTDNINRTISLVKTAFNKTKFKLGVEGSASFMYSNLGIISILHHKEEKILEFLLEENIDVQDIETEDDSVVIYVLPEDFYKTKEILFKYQKDIEIDIEEITMIPNETVVLTEQNLENFKKLITMLDDIEDVQNVYYNIVYD